MVTVVVVAEEGASAQPRVASSSAFRPPRPAGWGMRYGETRRSDDAACADRQRRKALGLRHRQPKKQLDARLVLYEHKDGHRVIVDPVLAERMSEYHLDGLRFLFECVASTRLGSFMGRGCVLADGQGLDKTVACCALLLTALRQGLTPDKPLVRRAILVTTSARARHWDHQMREWLSGRVRWLALAEDSKSEADERMEDFVEAGTHDVLVITYDELAKHARLLGSKEACDLLICDDGDRLKDGASATCQVLSTFCTQRRVVLVDEPPHDLDEFFALARFCNPLVLGTRKEYRKRFQQPILLGREPGATAEEIKLSKHLSDKLSRIGNAFILRRVLSFPQDVTTPLDPRMLRTPQPSSISTGTTSTGTGADAVIVSSEP